MCIRVGMVSFGTTYRDKQRSDGEWHSEIVLSWEAGYPSLQFKEEREGFTLPKSYLFFHIKGFFLSQFYAWEG